MDSYEIRTFDPATDGDQLYDLFGRAGQGAPTESLWGHRESEAAIYLTPYMELLPRSLLVASSAGQLVGYLTGCPDSSAFPSEDQRLTDAVKKYRLILRPGPAAFFGRSLIDMLSDRLHRRPAAGELHDSRWPSHLHVNVAPEARGAGVADALIRSWLERVRESGSPGCYLQTLTQNERAVRFFERMGFQSYGPAALVPGLRYRGARVHQRTMVIDCRSH